jgi:uncharacterized membrane protein
MRLFGGDQMLETSIWKNKNWFGAFLLGMGVIGMLDGIIFHQLLQWHSTNMHTDRQHQIVSDGFFHLVVTVITFWAGIVLWNSDPMTDLSTRKRMFASGLLMGAGTFNFLEGIINHHLLQLHHVRPGPNEFMYDLAFDASGIIMIILGFALLPNGFGKQKSTAH